MKKPILLIAALIGLSGQTAPAQTASPAASAGATTRTLVYQFGYNTKAAESGPGTGTTTIEIVGPAADGGLTVNSTDSWWNTVNPKQTSSCELYPDGGVTCAKRPFLLTGIQAAIVPLLGQNVFSGLSTAPNTAWNPSYKVNATFAPGVYRGFAGQPSTWDCAYTFTGKGMAPQAPALNLLTINGTMKQQGGRYLTVNQTGNILFDPRIKTPVFLSESVKLTPQMNVNKYTVELKLVRDSALGQ